MRPSLQHLCAFIVLALLSSNAYGQVPASMPAPALAPVLRMFVVYTQPAPGLHPFDAPGFVKLGYIADKPDLVWTELVSVHQTTEKVANGKLGPDGKIVVTSMSEV